MVASQPDLLPANPEQNSRNKHNSQTLFARAKGERPAVQLNVFSAPQRQRQQEPAGQQQRR